MNGQIIEGTPIAVDYWKLCHGNGDKNKYVHFLTHLHGDHVVGLTSTWRKPIYCSEITAKLLTERHEVNPTLLKILPLNEEVAVHTQDLAFTVMAFDANHCPGAVMLYFNGPFGKIFYTGDFRSSSEIIHTCTSVIRDVDVLYLDNTYCNARYTFPSRMECFERILNIIRLHPDKRIVIPVRRLGKETPLGELGVALNETIVVSNESYRLCKTIFDTNVFKTVQDSQNSRIWAVPLMGQREIRCVRQRDPNAIVIWPTALFTGMRVEEDPDVFIIPYSDHSSYPELVDFVTSMNPRKIKPIVQTSKDLMSFREFLGSCKYQDQSFKIGENEDYSSSLLINHKLDCAYERDAQEIGSTTHVETKKSYYIVGKDDDDKNGQGSWSAVDETVRDSALTRCNIIPFFKTRLTRDVSKFKKKKKCKKLQRKRSTAKGVMYTDEDCSTVSEFCVSPQMQTQPDSMYTVAGSPELCSNLVASSNLSSQVIKQDIEEEVSCAGCHDDSDPNDLENDVCFALPLGSTNMCASENSQVCVLNSDSFNRHDGSDARRRYKVHKDLKIKEKIKYPDSTYTNESIRFVPSHIHRLYYSREELMDANSRKIPVVSPVTASDRPVRKVTSNIGTNMCHRVAVSSLHVIPGSGTEKTAKKLQDADSGIKPKHCKSKNISSNSVTCKESACRKDLNRPSLCNKILDALSHIETIKREQAQKVSGFERRMHSEEAVFMNKSVDLTNPETVDSVQYPDLLQETETDKTNIEELALSSTPMCEKTRVINADECKREPFCHNLFSADSKEFVRAVRHFLSK